jgi:hypothetical protein
MPDIVVPGDTEQLITDNINGVCSTLEQTNQLVVSLLKACANEGLVRGINKFSTLHACLAAAGFSLEQCRHINSVNRLFKRSSLPPFGSLEDVVRDDVSEDDEENGGSTAFWND